MNLNPRPLDAHPLAHDRVYRQLRTRIMHGDLAPGQALTLRGIGKEYEVSMTPAREAVRRCGQGVWRAGGRAHRAQSSRPPFLQLCVAGLSCRETLLSIQVHVPTLVNKLKSTTCR